MFTFDQTPVKFVGLLVLLTWCTIWCARELARSRGARQRICDALHLLMAVVMLAMVPKPIWMALTGAIPVPVVVAAFAAATLWFVWLDRERGVVGKRVVKGVDLRGGRVI